VAVFYHLDHPSLKGKTRDPGRAEFGSLFAGYFDVLLLNVAPSESFTRHDLPALLVAYFVGDHMEGALSGVSTSMYREAPSDRLHCTRCAAWDTCPGFVCFEEVAGDEVLSGFPRKSWN
jgi:hypothetical protein